MLLFLKDLSKKQKLTFLGLVIIIISIPFVLYLSQKTQIFKPRAQEIQGQTHKVINFDPQVEQVLSPGDNLEGKGIPNAKVFISITPDGAMGGVGVDQDGKWTYQIPTTIQPKNYNLTITIEDIVGNIASIKTYKVRVVSPASSLRGSTLGEPWQSLDLVKTVYAQGTPTCFWPGQVWCQSANSCIWQGQPCPENPPPPRDLEPLGSEYNDWVARMKRLSIYPARDKLSQDIVFVSREDFQEQVCNNDPSCISPRYDEFIDGIRNHNFQYIIALGNKLREAPGCYVAFEVLNPYFGDASDFFEGQRLSLFNTAQFPSLFYMYQNPLGCQENQIKHEIDENTLAGFIDQTASQYSQDADDPNHDFFTTTETASLGFLPVSTILKLYALNDGYRGDAGLVADTGFAIANFVPIAKVGGVVRQVSRIGSHAITARTVLDIRDAAPRLRSIRESIQSKVGQGLRRGERVSQEAVQTQIDNQIERQLSEIPISQLGRAIDPTTRTLLSRYNANPETLVYRITTSDFIQDVGGVSYLRANPNSIAGGVEDYYTLPRRLDGLPSRRIEAGTLGPSLNVAIGHQPPVYYAEGPNSVMVSMRLGDFLEQGGRIYPDIYAEAAINPVILTAPEGRVRVRSIVPIRPAVGSDLAAHFPNIRFPLEVLSRADSNEITALASSADTITHAFPEKVFALLPNRQTHFSEGGFRFFYSDYADPTLQYSVYSRPHVNVPRARDELRVLALMEFKGLGPHSVDHLGEFEVDLNNITHNPTARNPLIIYRVPKTDPRGFLRLTESQGQSEIDRVATILERIDLRTQESLSVAIEKDTNKLVINHEWLTDREGGSNFRQALTDGVRQAVEDARRQFPEEVRLLDVPRDIQAGVTFTSRVLETESGTIIPHPEELKEVFELQPAAQSGLIKTVYAQITPQRISEITNALRAAETTPDNYIIQIPSDAIPGRYNLIAYMYRDDPQVSNEKILDSDSEPITITSVAATPTPSIQPPPPAGRTITSVSTNYAGQIQYLYRNSTFNPEQNILTPQSLSLNLQGVKDQPQLFTIPITVIYSDGTSKFIPLLFNYLNYNLPASALSPSPTTGTIPTPRPGTLPLGNGYYTNLCGSGTAANRNPNQIPGCEHCNSDNGSCTGDVTDYVYSFSCSGLQTQCNSVVNEISGTGLGTSPTTHFRTDLAQNNTTYGISVFDRDCYQDGVWLCGTQVPKSYMLWYSGPFQRSNPTPTPTPTPRGYTYPTPSTGGSNCAQAGRSCGGIVTCCDSNYECSSSYTCTLIQRRSNYSSCQTDNQCQSNYCDPTYHTCQNRPTPPPCTARGGYCGNTNYGQCCSGSTCKGPQGDPYCR